MRILAKHVMMMLSSLKILVLIHVQRECIMLQDFVKVRIISIKFLICLECTTGCRICNNSDTCEKCDVGYVFFNYTCLTECPDGYYDLDAICTGNF